MRRLPSAGLKYRQLIPNTLRSCLGPVELPYNWADKLRVLILGIALTRSVLLQDIARAQGKVVRTVESRLSRWLRRDRLELERVHRDYVVRALKRLGKRRLRLFRGKAILLVDSTSYPKKRSRGKKRRMPRIGKVRLHNLPTQETLLVPGYQEIWAGLLLKKKQACLGITRRLFTEHASFFPSQNTLEEAEIRKAKALVREALGLDVILVADRGFKRKELLLWLSHQEKTDFIIRLDGNLTAEIGGWTGLLRDLAPRQGERLRMFWRDDGKHPLFSAVRAFRAKLSHGKRSFSLGIVHLTPLNIHKDPMLLATSLSIRPRATVSEIVRLYSARWSIETFFFSFKQTFRAGRFRVFSSWRAIDNLLAAAHMAFLALCLVYLLSEDSRKRTLKAFRHCAEELARRLSAGPSQFTLSRFLEAIALDFLDFRPAWVARL